ncbi:MAG: Rieske 2Fe-2S domain-containing protein [Actinomycetota bacterium]|nr:Rieske 2Fe-2S domain-containing protein [Actinomycetota bacterium]
MTEQEQNDNSANLGADPPGHPDGVAASGERHQRRSARSIAVGFIVAIIAALSLAGVYAVGGQPQAEGALLAVAIGGLGFGITAWGKYLMPQGPYVQQREQLTSTDAARRTFGAAFERGEESIERRTVLRRLLVGAASALGLAFVFPIRSLGPNPGRSLLQTSWRPGSRMVDENGKPIRADALDVGGVATVFPEGHTDAADSQVVLIRVSDTPVVTRPGRETWSPEGYLAYSRVCTHAGCPVGLYQRDTQQLLCPCHQSLFDVLQGARPVFGPAPRSLPQLPIAVDAEGYLVAQRDFTEPVGPGFWNRR